MIRKTIVTAIGAVTGVVLLYAVAGGGSAQPVADHAITSAAVERRAQGDFEAYIRRPARVERQELSGRCPMSIRFQAAIISNGAGTARYRWVWSDGGTSRDETIRFRRRDVKLVSATWTVGRSFSGWGAIKLVSPVEGEPVRIMEFDLRCR